MPDQMPALQPHPDVLEFLATRRSRPAKTLVTPVPDRAVVEQLLTIAASTPDHGKLEPWRFCVLEREACVRLGALTRRIGVAKSMDADKLDKASAQFANAHLCVAVVASPKPSEKIPEIEQTLSAGAVCQQLLTAGLAAGWGASWLTNWMATDRDFLSEGLGLAAHEWVAGYVYLGSEGARPPERPRPDLAAITTWLSE